MNRRTFLRVADAGGVAGLSGGAGGAGGGTEAGSGSEASGSTATTTADLPDSFTRYAKAPPEGVTFTYDALRDELSTWTEAWERQVAGK